MPSLGGSGRYGGDDHNGREDRYRDNSDKHDDRKDWPSAGRDDDYDSDIDKEIRRDNSGRHDDRNSPPPPRPSTPPSGGGSDSSPPKPDNPPPDDRRTQPNGRRPKNRRKTAAEAFAEKVKATLADNPNAGGRFAGTDGRGATNEHAKFNHSDDPSAITEDGEKLLKDRVAAGAGQAVHQTTVDTFAGLLGDVGTAAAKLYEKWKTGKMAPAEKAAYEETMEQGLPEWATPAAGAAGSVAGAVTDLPLIGPAARVLTGGYQGNARSQYAQDEFGWSAPGRPPADPDEGLYDDRGSTPSAISGGMLTGGGNAAPSPTQPGFAIPTYDFNYNTHLRNFSRG